MKQLPRLYCIVDSAFFRTTAELVDFAGQLVAGGCALLQYRNKLGNAQVMLEQARELRRLSRAGASASQMRLIMNDRADLSLAAEFDGVHVGQEDLSPGSVRDHWTETLAGRIDAQSRATERGRSYDCRLSRHRACVCHFQQGKARSRDWPRRCAPGSAVNPQALGGDWRNYPSECRLSR